MLWLDESDLAARVAFIDVERRLLSALRQFPDAQHGGPALRRYNIYGRRHDACRYHAGHFGSPPVRYGAANQGDLISSSAGFLWKVPRPLSIGVTIPEAGLWVVFLGCFCPDSIRLDLLVY